MNNFEFHNPVHIVFGKGTIPQVGQLIPAGKKIMMIWGGGSKGVTFLNLLGTAETVAYVVDINPGKQGKYAAGSGQQYVAPEFLTRYRPEVVVIMNPIYRQEIESRLAALKLSPEIHTVV